MDLTTCVGEVELKNPVLTASGTSGCGEEVSEFMQLASLGAFVTKGVTLEARTGNPPPRVVETASGMLNAIGLQNIGLEKFLREKLPLLKDCGAPIVVNVAGSTCEEYVRVTETLSNTGLVQAVELNVSCPNVKHGGLAFGKDADTLRELVSVVREHCAVPLWVKLTPNVTDIGALAIAAEEAGADAIVAVNTFVGMAFDVETCQPILANRIGGLSGPAIKPLAMYAVDRVARACDLPVVAVGGISNGRDALEFLALGAVAIEVGTAMLVDPTLPLQIVQEIDAILRKKEILSLREWIGISNSNRREN